MKLIWGRSFSTLFNLSRLLNPHRCHPVTCTSNNKTYLLHVLHNLQATNTILVVGTKVSDVPIKVMVLILVVLVMVMVMALMVVALLKFERGKYLWSNEQPVMVKYKGTWIYWETPWLSFGKRLHVWKAMSKVWTKLISQFKNTYGDKIGRM